MSTFGLAVDNWSSTVGTAHTAGSGQIVLGALNGLPALPSGKVYRMTAVTNPETPTETILGIFEATGLSSSTLTGVTPAAGYTDVNLPAGTPLEIRVCKATIDELQSAALVIGNSIKNGAVNQVLFADASGNLAQSGNLVFLNNALGANKFNATTLYSSFAYPPTLSANTNDWNPGQGLSFAIQATAPINLTGMQFGVDGQFAYIWNIGTNTITLTQNDVSSLAGNRWLTSTAANIALANARCAFAVYNQVLTAWLVSLL
jgi:hypothetical protein